LEKFILVINPGSTSTKVALFRALENEVEVAVEDNVSVPVDLLEQKPHYVDQIDYRLQQVLEFLDKHGVTSDQILCIASRGGPIKPLPAGTYQITKEIEQDIMQERILSPHSSLIGPVVAFRLSQEWVSRLISLIQYRWTNSYLRLRSVDCRRFRATVRFMLSI